MYLYNSASHKKEEFIPNHPDIVKMTVLARSYTP